MEEMFPKALKLATKAHKGQFRDGIVRYETGEVVRTYGGGEAYIEHLKRVAANFKDDFTKTIAILHDSLENSSDFFGRKIKTEFPKEIINGIRALSRLKNESYFDFIFRIRNSGDVRIISVKIADLEDNLRDSPEGSRADKYRFAQYMLKRKLSDFGTSWHEISHGNDF